MNSGGVINVPMRGLVEGVVVVVIRGLVEGLIVVVMSDEGLTKN